MSVNEYVSGLERVEESGYPTYCSVGARVRALELSTMAEKGYAFLREFFQVDFEMPLLVLNQADWMNRTTQWDYGGIFADHGCIHFPADEDHTFLDIVQPLYEHCPEHLKSRLTSAVGDDGSPFRKAFGIYLDNKLVHELTHIFLRKLFRARNVFGLRWFNEFFCEYTNYAFLQRYKDEFSQGLIMHELLPDVLYEGGLPYAKYKKWRDFETLYSDVGWLNFMWFYARNMRGVIELYHIYREAFIKYVIEAYKPSNELLVGRLDATHTGLGHWFKNWLARTP